MNILSEFFVFVKHDLKDKRLFLLILFLTGLIIFNYTIDFEDSVLDSYVNTPKGTFYFSLFYSVVFLGALFCTIPLTTIKKIFQQKLFWMFLMTSMFFVALYQSQNPIRVLFKKSVYNYFSHKLVSQLDSLIIAIAMILFLGIWLGKSKYKLYGLLNFKFSAKIYFVFLALMIPLLVWAATQPDFLQEYPKLKFSRFPSETYTTKFLQYEPFYLLNFIGVEWYFRGFMVLAFSQFLDRKAIAIVASVYCVFHFGKPMAECISSFFGGYLLGYMVYKSKTIWGGVIVHMGIAFLMDIFALGSLFWL